MSLLQGREGGPGRARKARKAELCHIFKVKKKKSLPGLLSLGEQMRHRRACECLSLRRGRGDGEVPTHGLSAM